MSVDDATRYVSVLDDGLPALPAHVSPGQPVPIAFWTGERHGAVMVIEDCDHDPYCPGDEHYLAMTYAYRRGPHGWEAQNGAGGTDWPGGTSTNASLDATEVLLEGGPCGSSAGWTCWIVGGFTGSASRWVELHEASTITRRAIPASGAFVVVLDGQGPATVRILDEQKIVVETYTLYLTPAESAQLM